MTFLQKSMMKGFTGVLRVLGGRAAVQELKSFARAARIALVSLIAIAGMLFLCLLIVSTYFLIRIVQMIV